MRVRPFPAGEFEIDDPFANRGFNPAEINTSTTKNACRSA